MHSNRHPRSYRSVVVIAFAIASATTLVPTKRLHAQASKAETTRDSVTVPSEPSRGAMVYVTPFLSAGVGQTLGTPKAWPRTIGGYASRLGDQFGFLLVEESVKRVVDHAVPWHEDRTLCRAGPSSLGREVLSRLGCAIVRTSTLRSSDGGLRPNLPFIAGAAAGTGASLAWRPERSSAVSARSFAAQRLGITYGATVFVRMLTDWRADAKAGR